MPISSTTVSEQETAAMTLNVDIDGDEVELRLSGYSNPLSAFKALAYFGQLEKVHELMEAYIAAEDEFYQDRQE